MLKKLRFWARGSASPNRVDAPLDIVQRRVATVVGAVCLGAAALIFAYAGDRAQRWFAAGADRWPWATLIVSPLVFALAAGLTRRWAPAARGSGIPQVIAAIRSPDDRALGPLVSLRTAFAKVGLSLLVLLGGGSIGREGPTVQISTALMILFHRVFRAPITAGVLIAGGAAGVAAAFNTPLAGVAFAIEELAAAYEQRLALLVMGAVMIAGMTSLGLAGDYVYFGVMRQSLTLKEALLAAPAAGLAGGLAGGAFSRLAIGFGRTSLRQVRMLRERPILFALICGLVVAGVGIATSGATWGTGYEATRRLVEGHGLSIWFGPAKFASTLATTFSGVPGGIFAPSLAVGAGLGNILGSLFPSSAPGAIVVLCMSAYFVGVVRAPFTAVIIISETTGSRSMILPLFAAALIADGVSALVCKERLYHALAMPFEHPPSPEPR